MCCSLFATKQAVSRIGLGACVFVALISLVSAAAQDDAAKKDLKRLQGTWTMQALEVNGLNVAANSIQEAVLTIKDDRYELKLKDKVINTFTIALDTSKDPKELDMLLLEGANKNQVHKAIYKIDNDLFVFCRGLNPDQARPNQFATWPDTGYFVVTWKKQ